MSGVRDGDIQLFVDGLDTVVGELRSRCAASSTSTKREIERCLPSTSIHRPNLNRTQRMRSASVQLNLGPPRTRLVA